MSGYNFNHFTGKTRGKTSRKKKIRAKRNHKNKYEKYSNNRGKQLVISDETGSEEGREQIGNRGWPVYCWNYFNNGIPDKQISQRKDRRYISLHNCYITGYPKIFSTKIKRTMYM